MTRTRRAWARLLASLPLWTLGIGTLASAACHQRSVVSNDTAASASATADSARGTLLLVGNEPVSTLLLTAAEKNTEPLALTGALIPVLRRVVGLELAVFGQRTGARAADASPRGAAVFDVKTFVVQAADGVAAHDGVVEFRNSTWLLRLADGRELAVASMPALLRQQIGARVWIAGPLNVAPLSYGLIVPAR